MNLWKSDHESDHESDHGPTSPQAITAPITTDHGFCKSPGQAITAPITHRSRTTPTGAITPATPPRQGGRQSHGDPRTPTAAMRGGR